MDAIKDLIGWIITNKIDLLAIIGGIYGVLLIVVKLTPTPKDDELLSKISGFVLKIAGFFGIKK